MGEKQSVILITGVSGRIGSRAALLFSEHFHVVGLDIYEPKELMEKIDFILTDISSRENVRDSLSQCREKYGDKIVSCIHLAAYYNFSGGNWEQYEKITIEGTRNLLEALKDFQLEQFLFSSTLLVYAPGQLNEKIKEESAVDPKWPYPLSKIKTEQLIHENRADVSTVILRLSGVYDDRCHSIPISQQISRIYEKKLESHFFPGNLHHGATFLHMQDLLNALMLIVEKRKDLSAEELFVLGEPSVMSYGQLQEEIGRLLHCKKYHTWRIPKWMAKIGAFLQNKLAFGKKTFIQPWMIDLADDHYDVDISKAQKILGWQPKHTLKNSLPQMIELMKKDPKKWYAEHGLS